jgi:hypothetical protein
MPLRQMHEVPNGQNELSAKWAGSAKILGCYKRIFLIFLLDLVALDNNIENIRTANVNLKVTDRDNNCHISKVSYKMWDHWNFDFSPHKLTKDQKCIALELQEYHWQVRENSVFIKRTVSDLGGISFLIDQGIKFNWFQTCFRSRDKVVTKTRITGWIAKQIKTPHKGTYGNKLSNEREFIRILFWHNFHRMDTSASQHTEKRKRDDGYVSEEISGDAMDTITDFRALLLIQIGNYQRSDKRAEENKIKRFMNLRDEATRLALADEAIRLALATTPPTHLEDYQLRYNDI